MYYISKPSVTNTVTRRQQRCPTDRIKNRLCIFEEKRSEFGLLEERIKVL